MITIMDKSALIQVFKNSLDILRDNEGLTGEKALRNLSYLLILKLIEPHLDGAIDIDNYNFELEAKYDNADSHRQRLLEVIRFSNLSKEKDDNFSNILKYLWDDVLCVHPSTKNIFLRGKGFDIRYQSTFRKLINKLNILDLSKTEYDILGNAYEEVIQDIMTGKVLGQFFTQPLVKKMMVKLIDPQIYPDGKIESCGDPTMGTGGFLITYLQYILQQAKDKNIKPDWEFIKTDGLYGKEIEPDTYQLAVSNMLISSGHMFEKLDRGDSIREPITRKFDNILANPPFGIKGLKYDEIKSLLRSEYVPIKTDNAVSLFIQAIIYMLKVNGKCAVVLPDGQDLFSKTNKTLVAIREYLMKTCDLKEIIYLPSGIFTYTSIKTCVFYFIKKKEGTEVLETKIKISKTQKETGREYKFSKTHQTETIKFYEYDPSNENKKLLVEVPIDKIVNNSYSLNYAEYIEEDKTKKEEEYSKDIVVKTLGEVCEIEKNLKKHDTSYGKNEGKYKFHTGGERTDLYVDNCDIKELYIIQNRTNGSGKCNLYLDKNFSLAKQTIAYTALNKDENTTKYIYYYLLFNKEILEKGFIGANHKNISKDYISKLKIPIPPLEKQKEIVKYLDFIYERAIKTSNEKIAELKELNKYCIDNQVKFGDNVMKTLGDVCKVNQGTYIKSNMKISGEYPVYGGGNVSYYINQYNREDDIIVAKDGVSADCVRYEKNKFFLNHHGWTLICKKQIIKKYMFYYLQSIQSELLNIAKGAAQLGINQENFYKIKIPIPSLERQKEIVEYCEYNDTIIKQLDKDIENNKKQAEDFIKSIFKTKEPEDVESTEEDVESTEEEVEIIEEVEPTVEVGVKQKVKKSKKLNK